MLDQTDLTILAYLRRDARMQWKEIGERVHLTGQAVAARIRRMQELGVLQGFTVEVDQEKLGKPILAMITVFMTGTRHAEFQRYLASQPAVEEAHRVSGEGCYWLKARVATQAELTSLLDGILAFGNYRVNMSIGQVK